MEAMPETEKQVGPWANIGQPFWMGLGWMNGESSESSKRPETFQVGEGFRGESWNPTMKDTVENQCRSSVCDVSFGTGNKGKAFEKSSFFFIAQSHVVHYSMQLRSNCHELSAWVPSFGWNSSPFPKDFTDRVPLDQVLQPLVLGSWTREKRPSLEMCKKCQVFFLRFFRRKTMAVKILHWSFMTWMIYLG